MSLNQTPLSDFPFDAYQVGGAVRDGLLGLPIKDRDWVVVGATESALIDAGFRSIGADFPVFLHPETKEEYALARTEAKTGPGYHGFAVRFDPSVTLEEDLSRRDLTVNAMALDSTGDIIDPFGGQRDLKKGLLRHVSDAFKEDPLRVLRVARFHARFAQLGFSVAKETIQLMAQLVDSGELDHLTQERVWLETRKALETDTPSYYFKTLDQCGALAVIFPELAALKGKHQPEKYHPEGDAWIHTLLVIDQAAHISDDIPARFAALCHDLGKGQTPEHTLPHHRGHDVVGVPIAEALCDRLKVSNIFRSIALSTVRYHMLSHHTPKLKAKTIIKILKGINAFRNETAFERFLIACQADMQGRGEASPDTCPEIEILRQCRQACLEISVQTLQQQGLRGEKLGQAIHKARIRAISAIIKRSNQ
ncbi:MAG: multifunctional CCA addition/repair protein [Magnetococcales bacterium]|nr:multifunctional CCA addition/repair protein [Magnetococcales bacterium]